MTAPSPKLFFFHLNSLFGSRMKNLNAPAYAKIYLDLFQQLKKRGNKVILMYGADKAGETSRAFFENIQLLEHIRRMDLVDALIQAPFEAQQQSCDVLVEQFQGNVKDAFFIMPTLMDVTYVQCTGIGPANAMQAQLNAWQWLKGGQVVQNRESDKDYQDMKGGIYWFAGIANTP